MTLYEAEKGASYLIQGLYVEPAITRRLQALGLNDGTTVNVLNRKKHGALIIQVRGTRLALGKHISSNIEIKQSPEAQQENPGTKAGYPGTKQENAEKKAGYPGTKQENAGNKYGNPGAKQENAGTKQRNVEGSRQEVYK